jgi:anti-sigma factor RsiW
VSSELGCARAQELFSDHCDGSLHEILRVELERHLLACADCRALREGFEEVVAALRGHPAIEPSALLAERATAAALAGARQRPSRLALPVAAWPRSLRVAAAVVLVATGVALLGSGPDQAATRTARRLADRAGNAFVYLAERKDRVVEDVRILRVVIAAAFEGRLDQVNDRFDDYRKLIERRSSAGQRQQKKTGDKESNSSRADLVGRCEAWKERART